MKGSSWLENIRYNEKHYGFKETFKISNHGRKSLVLAAGPSFKRFNQKSMEKIISRRNDLTIIACDGALPVLSQFNCIPDYVVTVDPLQIVSDFYKKSRNILKNVTAILSTTTHPDVVEECITANLNIKWIQPFFNDGNNTNFFRRGVTSLKMGGNVGTTSYLFSALLLKSKFIGLMGIEFAWSDETPYYDTQYYKNLLNVLDDDHEKAIKHYVHVKNPRDGKTYVADPVYYAYSLMFKEIWNELPQSVRKNTFSLTPQGIVNIDHLKYINIDEYLNL
ncbi:MAG TPA: 6-hydroxymethylpterin diphosphokinase MptE-like protein [Nitrosopumilaceae archaeon]|nr:6-hydroxymethylpterin diphosphokinase MptE-like protein [Nitrosopumilaceae archaeon]